MTAIHEKLWRIRVWLWLQQKLVAAEPPKKPEDAPQKLMNIDIYPEVSCLRTDKILVNLKHYQSDTQKDTNYMLECFAKGNDPKATWDSISGTIELILDKLAFAFQIPIMKVRFEMLDMTPPLIIQTERSGLTGNQVPSIQKDSTIRMMENYGNKISPKLLNSKTDEMVESSIRWFAKGLMASAIVDKFSAYWIALESLSMPTKPREKIFFKCQKCGFEIQECTACKTSSKHYPDTKERLSDLVVKKLEFPQDVFDSLWNARMMFHARNKLSEQEVQQLFNNTIEVRKVVIKALKNRLDLAEEESPVLLDDGIAQAGEAFLGIRSKLTKEDIQSFDEVKLLLRATLYKGTHLLG